MKMARFISAVCGIGFLSILPLSTFPVLAQDIKTVQDTPITFGENALENRQDTAQRPVAAPSQEFCISMMSAFPNEEILQRYQFFKLTQDLALGATPDFQAALGYYGDQSVQQGMPITDMIEAIANPVIRQAAPELIVAYMGQLIEFTDTCSAYLKGQTNSLASYNPNLSLDDAAISEDALYLRQILLDALMRLGAEETPLYKASIVNYSQSLVAMRDSIEFDSYVGEIDEIEALYMADLDGRLARSNDIINSEVDREILGESLEAADKMARESRRRDKKIMSIIIRKN